ncbi:spinster family MFS transporter [Noviherbaspirillum saxi]|uniref:MFS transporter n=1 Tax=Noviherbaspirillum saxi TaxID=2320863 RepID=A0A3A3FH24_9BURK|nr:MFS transporter [Noviherbaspirillum saxi]RJF91698.1 MFS transporter [Noviherbaspirillum saxi]
MKLNDTIVAGSAKAPATEEAVPASSWYALAILTLIYSCHFLDRTMISIIVEPVRAEFKLSDSQLGLLTGLAYGATFALAGIPIGLLIDRVNRIRLMAVLVTIWSAMTALSGLAQSYIQLLLARMGVGASEAGGSPTSLSLISDFFPASRRSTAVGCFFLSNAIGATLSIFIGGFITAKYGWRAAMLVAGLPGIALAVVLILTVRNPKRGATDTGEVQQKAATLKEVAGYLSRNSAMLHLLAGISIITAAIATLGAWLPSFGMRFHGLSIKEAGMVSALAGGFFAAAGSVVGGLLSDRLGKKHPRRRIDLCFFICFATLLLAVGGTLVSKTPVAIGMMCFAMLVSFATFPASFGSMLSLAAPNMRGVTSATMQVCTNLVGYGLGPFMVGVLSDLYGGDQSLRYAMATVMCICCPWAALHFALSARARGRMAVGA